MPNVIPGLRARRGLVGSQLIAVENPWITFANGHITAMGVGTPPTKLPQAPGGFIMPGMVDCHVHLAMSGAADVQTDIATYNSKGLEQLVVGNAQAQVRSGVTTVRDLGSPNDMVVAKAPELNHSEHPTPMTVAAGAITSPAGHGHFLAREAEGVRAYEEAVSAVASTGARAVKLFATGGVVTHGTVPGATQMSREELIAATRVAHAHGLRVAVHAHGREGIRDGLAARVDSIEHFSHLDVDDVLPVLGSTTRLVTTLVATERFVAADDRAQACPDTLAKILNHAPQERAAVRRAIHAGCRLAVGTDAGTTFNSHGWGMQEQAGHLAAAGMTKADILALLTSAGAELLGEPCGSLEVGRRADILCLEGDPMNDLEALNNVTATVVRSCLVDTPQ